MLKRHRLWIATFILLSVGAFAWNVEARFGGWDTLTQFLGGTHTWTATQTFDENVIIDDTSTEAFLVRQDADAADVLIVDTTNQRVGINIAPTRALDIADGNIAMLVGADSAALTRTNATQKSGRFAVPHYTNAEEPLGIFNATAGSSANTIQIGGGTSGFNAATKIQLFTAANNTTQTGTSRLEIDSAGDVGIGASVVTGAQLTLPSENDAVTPTLAFGDGNTGVFEAADNSLSFAANGVEAMRIIGNDTGDIAVVFLGTAPGLGSCGTTPSVTGSDTAGKITIGTGTITSCTVTFTNAFATNAPACVIAGDNTAVTYAATTSTTVLTITSSADMATDVISYICLGIL